MTQGTLVPYNPPSLLAKHAATLTAGGQGAAQKLFRVKGGGQGEKRDVFYGDRVA